MLSSDRVPHDAATVTPSDTVVGLGYVGLYVGGTGDIKVTTDAGTDVVFKACPVGAQIRLAITRVYATGTTATLLIGIKP